MSLGLTTRGYYGGGSGGGSSGTIVSVTGNPNDRFTPIQVQTDCAAENLYIFFKAGDTKWVVYDPGDVVNSDLDTGFSAFMSERSSIDDSGDNLVINLLPNGGWWRADFELVFIAGTVMTT